MIEIFKKQNEKRFSGTLLRKTHGRKSRKTAFFLKAHKLFVFEKLR